MFRLEVPLCLGWRLLCGYLEGGDDLVPLLVDGDGVARVPLGVDDGVAALPADDDGLLPARGAVQLLGLALPGHGGVGVAGDHGGDWRDQRPVRTDSEHTEPGPINLDLPARL